MSKIQQIVKDHLTDASEQYLNEVVDHGIHNLTNDFHGETDEEYAEFADEFAAQAAELLGW